MTVKTFSVGRRHDPLGCEECVADRRRQLESRLGELAAETVRVRVQLEELPGARVGVRRAPVTGVHLDPDSYLLAEIAAERGEAS